MEITIKHLELCNFGMFRSYELDFDDKLTCIQGRNGSGKSTIANAVQWLFTGKSVDGRSQFSIKTHDRDGNEIPKVDHYVRAVCLINGEETELKKGINEKWTKVKGEDKEVMSNQTCYFINGTPLSQKEWNERMGDYVNEQVFKAVTNPNYFVSLDWKTQRDFLYRMVGGVRQDEIIGTGTSFDPLLKELEHQSIDEILKHIGYQIKELQKKLDLIPVRLAEQDKALPERQDWDAAKARLQEKRGKLKELQNRLSELRKNPSDALHKELEQKLAEVNNNIFHVKEKAKKDYEGNRTALNGEIGNLNRQILQDNNTIADLNAKVDGFDKLIKRANQAKLAAQTEKQKIEAAFETLRNTHLELPDNMEFCPACGQLLPQDQFQEKRDRLQEAFNKDKVDKANDLKARYQDAKKDISDAEDTANRYNGEIAKTKTHILKLKADTNAAEEKKAELRRKLDSLKAPEDALPLNDEYCNLEREHARIVARLENAETVSDSDTDRQETAIHDQIEATDNEISMIQDILASESQYNRVMKNKADIEDERAGIANRITLLESQLDLATEYSNRQGRILEDKVNSRFHYVKWRMFKNYLNGAREDFCECYVDGIAYHDTLNTSARTNAGLDIVSTLSEVYRAWCPIIIDNAESVNSLLPTKSQQIRMYVSDTDLTVK